MEQQSTRFVCDARRLLSTSNPNPLDLPHTYMGRSRGLGFEVERRRRASHTKRVLCCSILLLGGCSTHSDRSAGDEGKPGSSVASDHKSTKNTVRLGSPEWYTDQLAAADKGDMFAQLRVADCFYIGSCGFAKDQNEAMRYWDLAAEQGSGFAQGQLATAYQFGINGLQKDLTQAAKWWRRAA